MQDMNSMIARLQVRSSSVVAQSKSLFIEYENLYQEANRSFLLERNSTNVNMDELSELYRFVHVVKRNRDIMASLVRGFESLRPMNTFRIIEEDVSPTLENAKKIKRSSFSIPEELKGEIDGE